jgi:E3 ubiquitin-protein ligase BRE1
MASALSKEMGMMEAQLKRWKDAALEAVSLREKAHSLRATLSGKVILTKSLSFSFSPTL